MGRLNAARIAAFAALMIWLCSPARALAQVKGTPPSVTSLGFGGHFDRFETPPSVTSLGPKGYGDSSHLFVGSGFPPANPGQLHHHPAPGQNGQNSHHGGGFYPVYAPVYVLDPSLSYAPDDAGDAATDPAENQPAGPTIFDRRASGETSQSVEAAYAQRMPPELSQRPSASSAALEPADAASVPVKDQPTTVLMFKDGHRLEVQNYAVVGTTLYDMTPGHRSRIPLADLDLAATARQNNDRGIDFQLPAGTGIN